MNTAVATKKQTAFRLDGDLLERLKVKARRENRSLNNYVERVLMAVAYDEPNEITIAAMKRDVDTQTISLVRIGTYSELFKK